jgi:hypothetical protein
MESDPELNSDPDPLSEVRIRCSASELALIVDSFHEVTKKVTPIRNWTRFLFICVRGSGSSFGISVGFKFYLSKNWIRIWILAHQA